MAGYQSVHGTGPEVDELLQRAKTALQPGDVVGEGLPHAHTHGANGSDPITPQQIGAATAAQGQKADTALQPGSHLNYSGPNLMRYSNIWGSPMEQPTTSYGRSLLAVANGTSLVSLLPLVMASRYGEKPHTFAFPEATSAQRAANPPVTPGEKVRDPSTGQCFTGQVVSGSLQWVAEGTGSGAPTEYPDEPGALAMRGDATVEYAELFSLHMNAMATIMASLARKL